MSGNLSSLQLSPELRAALEKAVSAVHEIETIHIQTVSVSASNSAPGKNPTPTDIGGSLLGLAFTLDIDDGHKIFKLPEGFTANSASFHVHWTKNTDLNVAGHTVAWRITYVVFDGKTHNVAGVGTAITLNDTYDDAGTTSRIVHRTANYPVDGEFIPNYYTGIKVEAITPATGTPIAEPILISVDLILSKQIHLDE